jgi:hypothetical protein
MRFQREKFLKYYTMASITYNFVHPEAFNNFIPEAIAEKGYQHSQDLILIITVGIIIAGLGYIAYTWWQEQQQKKESQIKRQ